MNRTILFFLLCWLLQPIYLPPEIISAEAADFQLSNPGIELRRLQICENCGEPLVVTSIAPGAAVRCPKCRRVQRRLPDSELIIKVYQICPSCSQRLDVSNLKAHEAFRCGACGFEQRVLPEAVYTPPSNAGTGKIPANKTVKASPGLQPPFSREISEPVVPGLNAPEAKSTQEYDIEVENIPDTESTPQTEDETGNNSTPQPVKEEKEISQPHSSGFQNLPDIDNDIEGDVKILVNGEKIFESAIMRRVLAKFERYQLQNKETLSIKDKAELYVTIRKEAEKELINEELIVQEAAREGLIDTPGQETAELLPICRERLISRHAHLFTTPSTGDLLKFYKKNIKEFSSPDQLILDSIVVYNDRSSRRDSRSSEIIASEVKERLDKGVDFTLLASRYSEGAFHNEGGRIRKVDSQFISANFLIKPLRHKSSSLQSGDMFGPIDLPSCKLFVQIAEVKHGSAKPFATVRNEVQKSLTSQSLDREFTNWLSTIRKAAVIEYKK